MRDPQRNIKATTPFRNYKPSLDTLEDRSLPGNSMLGLTGMVMPFAASIQKAIETAATKPNTTTKTTAKPTATSPLIASSISPASLLAAFFGNKQGVPSNIIPTGIAQIQSSFSSNTGSTKVDSGESWDSILTKFLSQSNNTSASTSDSSASNSKAIATLNALVPASDNGSSLDHALASTNKVSTSASTTSYTTYSPHSIFTLSEGDNGSYDSRGAIQAQASKGGLSAQQLAAAAVLQSQIPNLSYTVDNVFGTPRSIINTTDPLTGPSTLSPLTIVNNFITTNSTFLGISASDIKTLKNTDTYAWNNSANTIVNLQQYVNNIPVDGAMINSGVRSDGSLVIVNNTMVPNVQASVNTSKPVLTAQQAIIAATTDAGLTYRGVLTPTAPIGTEQVPTFINTNISIDPIPVSLEYLPITSGQVRLVYTTRLYIPNSNYDLTFTVDAVSGQIWTRGNEVMGDSYRVFVPPIANPVEGSRTLVTNPADPTASPYGWLDINGKVGADYNYTRGNNVYARYGPDADPSAGILNGTPAFATGNGVFDFPLNLKNEPSTYANASTTQLFYDLNYYHDVLYKDGFNEVAGNYQQNNYGHTQTTKQGDPIYAFAQSGANLGQSNNAYFVGAPDGSIGRIAMFIWDLTGPNRDGDLDQQIIFHEATHGTSGRLVTNLYTTFEGRGLGEGYSDYYALAMTLKDTDNKTTVRTVGNYVEGQPANGPGIRNYPYSYDMSKSPYTYSDFDPAQTAHGDGNGFYSFYTMGEIWTNALNDFTLNMKDAYGYTSDLLNGDAGNTRALKMVTAGMALTAAGGNALDSRNGVVAADQLLYNGAYQQPLWNAMARRGMGIYARGGVPDSSNAANNPPTPLSIREDFTEPDYGIVTPPPPPVGGDGSNDYLYEPNETSNAAFSLGSLTGANTLTNLQIKQNPAGKAGDRDWFSFTPTKAGALTLTAQVSSSAGDLDVRLYKSKNGSSTILTEVGVGQGTHRVAGASETITVAVAAGTTYYFNVAGFNGAIGNYNLNILAPS
jgi:extracellular elastinolytic metalloproteinase